MTRSKIPVTIIVLLMFAAIAFGQEALKSGTSAAFSLTKDQEKDFSIVLREGQLADIRTDVKDFFSLEISIAGSNGKPISEHEDASAGCVFIAPADGMYRITFKLNEYEEKEAASQPKRFTVSYSNNLALSAGAKVAASRRINGYDVRIVNETRDEGDSYLLIRKGGEVKGILRRVKQLTGGIFFSDDPEHVYDDPEQKRANLLYRSTPDKTGDGNPDISVEYYSGGAHCCYEITFFELGPKVRQLSTIDTDNDRLKALRKRPGGGLLFHWSEQVFAYWAIAFAFSPFPDVFYDFQNGELSPRFDLMKEPAPTMAVLRRKAAAAKAKMNLNPWVSPEDNFHDFEEAFWGEMLDLMYAGHEDLAWKYFDLVWPKDKPGKEKFAADFREQLAESAYARRLRNQ